MGDMRQMRDWAKKLERWARVMLICYFKIYEHVAETGTALLILTGRKVSLRKEFQLQEMHR